MPRTGPGDHVQRVEPASCRKEFDLRLTNSPNAQETVQFFFGNIRQVAHGGVLPSLTQKSFAEVGPLPPAWKTTDRGLILACTSN